MSDIFERGDTKMGIGEAERWARDEVPGRGTWKRMHKSGKQGGDQKGERGGNGSKTLYIPWHRHCSYSAAVIVDTGQMCGFAAARFAKLN